MRELRWNSKWARQASPLATRLRWVSIAAFGTSVAPDVGSSSLTSSGEIAPRAGAGIASANTFANLLRRRRAARRQHAGVVADLEFAPARPLQSLGIDEARRGGVHDRSLLAASESSRRQPACEMIAQEIDVAKSQRPVEIGDGRRGARRRANRSSAVVTPTSGSARPGGWSLVQGCSLVGGQGIGRRFVRVRRHCRTPSLS